LVGKKSRFKWLLESVGLSGWNLDRKFVTVEMGDYNNIEWLAAKHLSRSLPLESVL
jgi:hypothetical protein